MGGHAVMQFTEPRFTKVLDLWVRPDPTNAERVFRALCAFGAPVSEVTAKDFESPDSVDFAEPWPSRVDALALERVIARRV